MLKMSLDVSTTQTGAVLQKQNERIISAKIFKVENKDPVERIRTMWTEIMKWMAGKKFDILIITKSSYTFSSQHILLLEGMLLSTAVMRGIPFDYYPDVAWYSKIGFTKDKREVKKVKSLMRFAERNNIEATGQVQNKNGKFYIITKDNQIIYDDIADAFNSGDLYEKRQVDYSIRMLKSSRQKSINRLRSQNIKIKNKIKVRSLKNKEIQKQLLVLRAQNKTKMVETRKRRIEKLNTEILLLYKELGINNLKIKRLRNE